MITLFISGNCKDTPAALKAFSESGIDYRLVDIAENMTNLKEFLHYRDNSSFFKSVKMKNNVGVPSIMINNGDKFYLFSEDLDLHSLED